MCSSRFVGVVLLIVGLVGVTWGNPVRKTNKDSIYSLPTTETNQVETTTTELLGVNWGKAAEATPTNRIESTTAIIPTTTELSEEVKCQAAWQKFLIDFNVRYHCDCEKIKRRGIFCENLKKIQQHNLQHELGKVSHRERVNQWSDLTFEEWKKSQRPIPAPEPSKRTTTERTKEDRNTSKCKAAWEKFLTDYGNTYATKFEADRRQNIFCENLRKIEEHNTEYELGKVSYKKRINQWSDLTFEEWKKSQRPAVRQ
ncbi:hypothetical protein KR009_000328 [Drosophila setifemur]|nr:hypothetical protein KR009_000328 [Drosophila setifemur]